MDNQNAMTLGRRISIWLGSFLLVGGLLYFFGGVPLAPLALGGVLALIVAFVQHFSKRR